MSVRQGGNTIAGTGYTKSEIDTIANGKANVALDNITSAGKTVCANMSMPSGTYNNLTLGANGSTYTAPADGWFCLSAIATNNTSYVTLNVGAIYQSSSGENTDPESVLIPAKKGAVATIYYANINLVTFRFVYANGVA